MRFKRYLIERRMKSDRILVYHGTSSKFLNKILKQGLIVDPKAKVWKDDPYASEIQASRVSLDGIYLAKNFGTASSASTNATQKFGGNPVIVIALFQPRSSLPDEDNIRYTLERIISSSLGTGFSEFHYAFNLGLLLKGKDKELTKRYLDGLKSYMERLNIDERAFDKKVAMNFLIAELKRALSHRWHKNDTAKWEIKKGWIEVYNRTKGRVLTGSDEDQKIADKLYKELDKVIPKPAEAEKNYLKALDDMTRMLKGQRKEYKKDNFINFRSLENVTYKGRNRIIAVAEIVNRFDDDEPTKIVVHYGKLPNEFLREFESRITKDYEVVKK